MADNKNDDLINDILNQLDNAKKEAEAESVKINGTAEAAESRPAEIPEEPPKPEPAADINEHTRADVHINKTHEDKEGNEPVQAAPKPLRRNLPHHDEAVPMRSDAALKRHPKKKKKKKRSRLPGVLILTVFIFAVSVCLSMVIIAFGRDMFGIGKSDTTKLIIVPEGASTVEISELLYDEGIINSPKCFQLFSKFRKSADIYLPGEHFVSPSMAYETIINSLTNEAEEEKKEAVTITFVEGKTIYDAAELLEKEGVCNANDFIFNFNAAGLGFDFEQYLPTSPNVLKFADARMEGYLFPDTYTFTKDMEPEQVCQKIYFNFNQKMTKERLDRMKELNLTLEQLIILSSVVQMEAPNREDMNHVASVFWNRLEHPDIFPSLQSDPTTNYAYNVVKQHLPVSNKEMIDAYDTYVGTGLPPGAICSPGLDAIDAVLEKMPSEDYFFIANIYTGQTYFSVTNDEHEQKKAQVQADQALWEEEEAARKAAEEAAANG